VGVLAEQAGQLEPRLPPGFALKLRQHVLGGVVTWVRGGGRTERSAARRVGRSADEDRDVCAQPEESRGASLGVAQLGLGERGDDVQPLVGPLVGGEAEEELLQSAVGAAAE
jgi:hypothetical protein